jgi:hypothetical protein
MGRCLNRLWSRAFQYFDVGDGSGAPELYSVGPDGFEDDFIG